MSDTTAIQTSCETLLTATQGVLNWSWEDDVPVALATFSADAVNDVRAALERTIPQTWSTDNYNDAPAPVQALARSLGGIRPGQLLFTAQSDPMLFAAWWPWGNKTTISLRVGLTPFELAGAEGMDLVSKFRAWFGLM